MRLEYDIDEHGQRIGTPVADAAPPRIPDREHIHEGRYCRLVPLDAALHAADLWDAFAADEAARLWTYMGAGPFHGFPTFEPWVETMAQSRDPFFYAIVDRATGHAIGIASYLRIDPAARSIEVGWITYSPRLQRTRIATDTMYVMMREAFAMGYRRYEWKCNALNEASIAAAHRLGFSFDGLFRHALVVKGRNRDTAWFSVTDTDWPRLQPAFEQWLDSANFDEHGQQRLRLSDLTAHVVVSRWPHLNIEV